MIERGWSESTAAVALSGLDQMGSAKLAHLLVDRSPRAVVGWLLDGGVPAGCSRSVAVAWRALLTAFDTGRAAALLAEGQIDVSWLGGPEHPAFLADDIDPAPVLFRRGRAIDETAPSVAVVGTRRASGVGREVARELGIGLAEAGVTVVSGLALGIDGAAHEGALLADATPPLAFVGGGVDVVYPKRHHDLWQRMVRIGTVASEAPPSSPPTAWRFPARNRFIAAAADIVVVVESRVAGGSLLTVNEAIRRGREVMAVPGSVRNPAAAGVNTLLADGCAPVLGVDDVLTALGLSMADRASRRAASQSPSEASPRPSARASKAADSVLACCDDGPSSIDELVRRSGLPTGEVLAAVSELVVGGVLVDDGARVRRR